MRAHIFAAAAAGVVLLAPTAALAALALPPESFFVKADLIPKIGMWGLIVASVAAIAITIRKVTAGPNIPGGSAFIAALRLGGPLVGLLGAVYTAFNLLVGITNIGRAGPFVIWAPALAEGMLILIVGLVAGVIGVVCHAVVEARIDRAVLRP